MSNDDTLSSATVTIQKYIRLSNAQQQYQQLKKMNTKRTGLVKEILATETNYVNRLTILEEIFKKPLEENANSAAPFVTKQQVRTLFSDIEVILNLNRVVLQELKDRVNNWTIRSLIGDIFVKLGTIGAFRWYQSYISNYNKAFDTLQTLKANNKQFRDFIEVQQKRPEVNLDNLESLLILPIQRIPQYNLLLNDLLKNTWPHHPDYKNLKAATKIMKEIASVVNEKKRESENIRKVADLGNKILGFPQLAVPHRRFVSETKFKNIAIDNNLLQPERTVVVFVFNDVVLLTVPQGDKYEVEIYSYFGRVSLDDSPGGPNKDRTIKLKLKEKWYTLLCQNEKEKTSWVVTFLNTVQLARKLEAEQRRISAQRHNLALKLSNRPTKEDLVESGILAKEAVTPREGSQSEAKSQKTESGTSVKKTPRAPKKPRNSFEQETEEDEVSQEQEVAEEDVEDDTEQTDSSQEASWISYPTFEAIQQALSSVTNFTSSDLQNILDQRRGRLRFIVPIDIHAGKKKIHTNLLVITDFRILFINKGKVVHEAHILDLALIRSKEPHELYLQFKNFVVEGMSDQTDSIINQIRRVFMTNFPGMPESAWFAVEVQPENRLEKLPVDTYANSLPCGGFVDSYKSLCDFLDIEPRSDIIWDIKHLHATQKITEFNFKHFELPEEDDQYRAMMAALRYNPYFTSLVCKDIKTLTKDSMTAIMNLFKYNVAITDITFANSNFTRDSYVLLCDALTFNKRNCNLRYLDLSNTLVEDKGITFLASYIERVNHVKLEHINLSNCAIGPKGLTLLFQAFKKSTIINTLKFLNISDNKLETDASSVLATWLAIPNKTLQVLKISNTQAKLSTLINGMMRGCPQLLELDISKNKFSEKSLPALIHYIQGSYSLQRLNISSLNLTPEHFGEIWSAIHENVYLKQLSLDASLNNFGLPGAFIICQHLPKCHGIVELILKDNEFGDEGVGNICAALATAEEAAIESLILDGNFKWKNQRERFTTVKKIATLLSSPNCKLKKLSLTGGPKSSGQLKQDLAPALLALAQNFTLEELNITGHKLGNKGLFALARALQTNTALKTLLWDENALTLSALERLVAAMKYNLTLCNAPIPAQDIAPLFLQSDAPIQQYIMTLIAEFQNLLARNYYKKEEEIKKQQQIREQQRETQHRLKMQQLQRQTLRTQGSLPPPKKPRKTFMKGLLALTSQGAESLTAKPKAKQPPDKKTTTTTTTTTTTKTTTSTMTAKSTETTSSKTKTHPSEEHPPTRSREATHTPTIAVNSTTAAAIATATTITTADAVKEPSAQTAPKGKKVVKKTRRAGEEKPKEQIKPRKEPPESKENKIPKKIQPPARKVSSRVKDEGKPANVSSGVSTTTVQTTTPTTASSSTSSSTHLPSSSVSSSTTTTHPTATASSKRRSAKNPKKPSSSSHTSVAPVASQQLPSHSQQGSASTAGATAGGLTVPSIAKKTDKKPKRADKPKKGIEKSAPKREKTRLSKFEQERLELIQGLMKRDLSKELAESPVASLFAKPPIVTPSQVPTSETTTTQPTTTTTTTTTSSSTSPQPTTTTQPTTTATSTTTSIPSSIQLSTKEETKTTSPSLSQSLTETESPKTVEQNLQTSPTTSLPPPLVPPEEPKVEPVPTVSTVSVQPEASTLPVEVAEESSEEGPSESLNEQEVASVESEGEDETPPAPPSIEDIQSVMKTPLEEEKPTAAESQTEVPELHLPLVDISSVPPPPPLTGRDLTGSDLIGRQLETVSNRSDTSGEDEGEGEAEGEEGTISESDNEDEKSDDVSGEDQQNISSEDDDVSNEEEDTPNKHDTTQASEILTNDPETNQTTDNNNTTSTLS